MRAQKNGSGEPNCIDNNLWVGMEEAMRGVVNIDRLGILRCSVESNLAREDALTGEGEAL